MTKNIKCKLCGDEIGSPMYLGDEPLCDHGKECYLQVKRGLVPLPDGRWWEQVWTLMFDNTVHKTAGIKWVKTKPEQDVFPEQIELEEVNE